MTQEAVVRDFPALSSRSEFEAFKRKWQYLYAYAGAGFAKGYITCHMLTFIREVSIEVLVLIKTLAKETQQNDIPEVACD